MNNAVYSPVWNCVDSFAFLWFHYCLFYKLKHGNLLRSAKYCKCTNGGHRTVQPRTISPPKIDDGSDSSFRRPSKRKRDCKCGHANKASISLLTTKPDAWLNTYIQRTEKALRLTRKSIFFVRLWIYSRTERISHCFQKLFALIQHFYTCAIDLCWALHSQVNICRHFNAVATNNLHKTHKHIITNCFCRIIFRMCSNIRYLLSLIQGRVVTKEGGGGNMLRAPSQWDATAEMCCKCFLQWNKFTPERL